MSILVWIVYRSSRRHHLDHLDAVTWLISTLSPGSSQRHDTSLALPKLLCWVGDWLHVLRSRQISYSLSRLALSVLFSLLHGQHMHSEFGVGPPSCLDLARVHPILLPSSGSSQSLTVIPSNAVVLDPPSASRLFLFSPSWLLH